MPSVAALSMINSWYACCCCVARDSSASASLPVRTARQNMPCRVNACSRNLRTTSLLSIASKRAPFSSGSIGCATGEGTAPHWIVNQNVLPQPGTLATPIWPPMASTN